MSYTTRRFPYNSPEYKLALELRDKVLRQPLGLKFTVDELKKDEYDTHFGLFEGNEILACLILTEMPDKRMKMRQVAVDAGMQGQGLGRQLCLASEKHAAEYGFNIMFCHARKTAVPFYLSLGYSTVGDEFTEVNIPHYVMEKQLPVNG